MIEELANIDTSSIDELRTIKQEQQVLQERMDKMSSKKDSVSEVVFQRVQTDYQERYDQLEDSARPLKEKARTEYAKLRDLIVELEETLEDSRLGKEELEFRHDLGEFDDETFQAQVKDADKSLKACQKDVDKANGLKEKFVEAFHSQEELDVAAPPVVEPPPVPPVSPPPAHTSEVEEQDVDSTTAEMAVENVDAVQEPEAEQEESEEQDEDLDDGDNDATAYLAVSRLVAAVGDGSFEEYQLKPTTTTIGRLDTNDICIPDGAISRYHAKIVLQEEGFVVIDLDSENGVFVNGERVTECPLKDGDSLEIGPGTKQFTFREA